MLMNRAKRSKMGFTLVELIVVIVVLAILAGVALPLDSGYVRKANEASDLQLLSAVNTAFSAACLSHGLDPRQVNASARINEEDHRLVLSLSSVDLYNAFYAIFGVNADTPFRFYQSLAYDKANGVFVNGDKTITVASDGGTVSATMSQLADFQNSTFGELEFTQLIDDLNKVANALVKPIGDTAPSVSPELEPFLESLGFSEAELSDPGNQSAVQNAMILYIASTTDQSMEIDSVIEQMTAEADIPHISNTGNPTADLAADLVFAYSLAESYVNSGLASEKQKNDFRQFNEQSINHITTASVRDLFRSFLTEDNGTENSFEQYLDSTGKSDIKGYLSALKVMKDNSSILSSDNLDALLGEGSYYATLGSLFGN